MGANSSLFLFQLFGVNLLGLTSTNCLSIVLLSYGRFPAICGTHPLNVLFQLLYARWLCILGAGVRKGASFESLLCSALQLTPSFGLGVPKSRISLVPFLCGISAHICQRWGRM